MIKNKTRGNSGNAGNALGFALTHEHGKLPNFNPPSKHAAGRVGQKRPKRRNRRKP